MPLPAASCSRDFTDLLHTLVSVTDAEAPGETAVCGHSDPVDDVNDIDDSPEPKTCLTIAILGMASSLRGPALSLILSPAKEHRIVHAGNLLVVFGCGSPGPTLRP